MPPRAVLISVFITLFLAFSYVHQDGYRSFIPASRLDLLHAIWNHQSFKIDAYHRNTSNKAVHDGHYYSDKAPGTCALALPAFSIAVAVLDVSGIPLDSTSGWLISSWIACAGSLAVVTALGGLALFVWLCRWVRPREGLVTALGVFLGAAPFPYCTLMMSHATVVGLLAIALWATEWGLKEMRTCKRRDIVAGFCCGLALASEYSAGIAACSILAWCIVSDFRRLFPIGLGMVAPLMLIPAYHWICFGTPFTVGYLNEAFFTEMHEGFFGIKFPPKADHAFMLLLSLERGLFYWSPILLLAFVGYLRLSQISMPLLCLTYLVPVLQVVAISAYFFPSAGELLGPRLLTPILPLIALPVALGAARFPKTGCLLATVSIFMTTVATAVGILIPSGERNPFVNFHLARLVDGKLSYNLGSILGLPPHASLIPLLLILGGGIWFTWRHLPPLMEQTEDCGQGRENRNE